MVDVLILGAGASGLMAARNISQTGKSVTVLEARSRPGGRIFTMDEKNFSESVEGGAEFMHGKLPVTQQLMHESGESFYEADGDTWNIFNGELVEGDLSPGGWDVVLEKLNQLSSDMTIADFLNEYFGSDEHKPLRESIIRFVEGYDAADATKASAFGLREEWSEEDSLTSYRPQKKYGHLVSFLVTDCKKHGVVFHFSYEVSEIHWREGFVEVKTTSGARFVGKRILITIPPSVLQTKSILFTPSLPSTYQQAIDRIQTGAIIKIVIEFKDAIWDRNDTFRHMPNLFFLFSDAFIPTWWTQKPSSQPLLTGWLAGDRARQNTKNEQQLLQDAIVSLAYIFGCTPEQLHESIRAMRVINWMDDPYSKGAYAYKTVHTTEDYKTLSKPIVNTLYFAGEAYYNGSAMGTVEAAFVSGQDAAKRICV